MWFLYRFELASPEFCLSVYIDSLLKSMCVFIFKGFECLGFCVEVKGIEKAVFISM